MGLSAVATSGEKGAYYTKLFTSAAAVWGLTDAATEQGPIEAGPRHFLRQATQNVLKRTVPVFLLSATYYGTYVGVEQARGGLKSSTNAVVASAALGSAYTLMYKDMKMGAFIAIVAGSWGWYKEFEDKIYGRS